MPPATDAIDLSQKLIVYCKYSHSPSIHSLNLIGTRKRTKSHEVLEECERNLQSTVCDLYKSNIEFKKDRLKLRAFVPKKLCSRCENTFTIRIKQFYSVSPGFTQHRKDIVGKKFSDHPLINHFDIIDYSKKSYDFVPHLLIKPYEHLIYPSLVPYFEKQIKISHSRQLQLLLPKLVSALKLLNLESSSTSCLIFYSLVVDSIREKQLDEPLMLLDVWKSLLMSDHLIVRAFEKLTDHFPHHSKEKLRWVLVMASYLKFDLYGAWMRGNKLKNFSNCPVTSAMLMGDFDQMKLLLDYGFLPNSQPITRYNVYMRHLYRCNRQGIDIHFYPLGLNFVVREVLMFLIIRNKRQDDALAAKMDKCFYLLWSSIPHPMVTKRQLLEESVELYAECSKEPVNLPLKHAVENLIDGYDQMDLDVGDKVMPRPLHHLCKCSVRQRLTVTGHLPYGISKLPLCKKLQEYLLVPDEQVFRQRMTTN